MANRFRKRFNFESGTLGAALAAGATTIDFGTAPGFPTLAADEFIPISIDDKEIVYLTAYTAAQTTGTIQRGREGTADQAHASGVGWDHGPMANDLLPINSLWDRIYEHLLPAGTNVSGQDRDILLSVDVFRVFIHFGSHNAASWKSPVNAKLTVPVNQKLVVLQAFGAGVLHTDPTNRKARLRNVTDVVDVLAEVEFQSRSAMLQWTGDMGAHSFREVAAGKAVELQLFSGDANQRAMGALVVCQLLGV